MILERYIEAPSEKKFDLIIVGGGITGAAVAYIAAALGLSVALFEKKDYGGATSAATSKLIHGGLRYLANMEFSRDTIEYESRNYGTDSKIVFQIAREDPRYAEVISVSVRIP